MKIIVFNVYCLKKSLNYKLKISPENGQPHPFHPIQFPLPHWLNALVASQNAKIFNIIIYIYIFKGDNKFSMLPYIPTNPSWTPKIHH